MIKSISIKNTATFTDPGIKVSEFKKVNFFYGANGSGKTTISNFLYEPSNDNFSECDLKWSNDIELKTLVYNKVFRERNFEGSSIPGVFTLGEATKEQTKIIEEKLKALEELKEKGVQQKIVLDNQIEKKHTLENDFRETVWNTVYKKYETRFKEAFRGVMAKKTFLARLIDEFNGNTSSSKPLSDLEKRAKTIMGETPLKLEPIQPIDFTKLSQIEKDNIWRKKIIGKADVEIATLIQRLNINDWVNQGKEYLLENETCPFCQQATITNGFRLQLEAYFDETFSTDTTNVKNYNEDYIDAYEDILVRLTQIEEIEKLNKKSKINVEKLSTFSKTLSSKFNMNKELLTSKIKEPSRSLELTSTREQLEEINDLIAEANNEIEDNNNIVDNYKAERIVLIHQIWKLLVEENTVYIEGYLKQFDGLEKGISNINNNLLALREDYKKLDEEIKELTKNVTSIKPSIDAINQTLKSFGFQNFEIVPSKVGINQCQVQRENGELVEATLSEGEITFLTFLYFLQLSKGSTNEAEITNDRILVIDDPISSLDSNVLFVVSSLLKEVIKTVRNIEGSIKQLIILTHNVYFHKEVSFINGRHKVCKDTNYWILRKIENVSYLQDFELVNPIQNSYELLWKELKNNNHQSSITIQNTMRRIIENYFKILGGYVDEDIINKFKNPQEKEICRSLICWINEGSHTIPDDLFVELQDNTIENYFKVFKSIFKQTGHIAHYEMMMN